VRNSPLESEIRLCHCELIDAGATTLAAVTAFEWIADEILL